MSYDLIVIGAGPGGYVAAIRAKQWGMGRVAVVEKGHVGGTCLNIGCIPSKTMIASAQRIEQLRHAETLGVTGVDTNNIGINVAALMARKGKVISTLRGGVEQLLKGHGVELLRGTAKIRGAGEITIEGIARAAKQIIIATGSSWRTVPGFDIDGTQVVVSDHMFDWEAPPQHLLIMGGGVIGCEFASMMRAFGSQVTIVEVLETLIPGEDPIIGKTLARAFTKKGIAVHTGTKITSLARGAAVTATLSNGETIVADKALIAVGRRPYTDDLGADELGILDDHGFVRVNERMATAVGGIYAIGDVIGGAMLAHVASFEGEVAVRNCLGQEASMSYHAVPRPIFTLPEICAVGATEAELQAQGITYRTGRFGYQGLSKAICVGETEGAMTVYADEHGYILGGHIIGAEATDLAQQLCLAVQHGMTIAQVAETIHAHPTMSEIVKEAVEDAAGHAVHKVTRK